MKLSTKIIWGFFLEMNFFILTGFLLARGNILGSLIVWFLGLIMAWAVGVLIKLEVVTTKKKNELVN